MLRPKGMEEFSYLCAPITEVVHGYDFPPARTVYVGQERPDDGASKMTHMEFLGDIRRRILDDDFLAGARRVCAVLDLLRLRMVCEVVDLGKHLADEGWGVQLKM